MADDARLAELRGLLADALTAPDGGPWWSPQHAADLLLPVVTGWAERETARRTAEELEQLADQRTWVTEHDNEVVSACDLYEHVARLRGELEPVTYDFPPDDSAAALAARDREA